MARARWLFAAAWLARAGGARDWRMLDSYPKHYVLPKLGEGESISIDGLLDEPPGRTWSGQRVSVTSLGTATCN